MRGYSVSKKLVKLTRFQCFLLQLSGNQGIPLRCVINFNTLVGYSSVQDQLKTASQWKGILNTDIKSVLQNINKFAVGQTRPILTNTRSSRSHEYCREF